MTIENKESRAAEPVYLYNSYTHRKDEFKTREPGKVGMYTCGPTVYHFAHIGNLRSYIMEDVLEKFLRFDGYEVKRVMNITDVGHLSSDADTGEDKMVAGAKREHKSVMDIAKFYTDAFFEDCEKLNIKRPDVVEPATRLIPEYIHMIEVLMEKGFAYEAGGNIYFDTSKLKRYYVFNAHDEEDLLTGARDDVFEDTNKRNKTDFVLWFTKSKFEDQELKWESPWGMGYPGWHIECSNISIKHLGEYCDLHCGGVDNAFPHHTNEIAQSEAYLGHEWCTQWMHVAHLYDEHGKISKSKIVAAEKEAEEAGKGAEAEKPEMLTVSLLEKKGFDPLVYRFFCLQSHYRKVLTFSWAAMDNAAKAYEKLISRIAALKPEEGAAGQSEPQGALLEGFRKALANDMNTSLAVTALYDVLKADAEDSEKLEAIRSMDSVLSLSLIERAAAYREKKAQEEKAKAEAAAKGEAGALAIIADFEIPEKVRALIEERAAAKKAKDFARADALRGELAALGYSVKDTAAGPELTRL